MLLCSLPGLEDYQVSFTMLLELARSSHSLCVPEFTQPVEKREREGERKQQNISDRTTADSEGERKGSWKAVSTGGRRGGG